MKRPKGYRYRQKPHPAAHSAENDHLELVRSRPDSLAQAARQTAKRDMIIDDRQRMAAHVIGQRHRALEVHPAEKLAGLLLKALTSFVLKPG